MNFDQLLIQHKSRLKSINVKKDTVIKPRHTGFKIIRMYKILKQLYKNNNTMTCKSLCNNTDISKTQLYEYARHLINHGLIVEIRDRIQVKKLDSRNGHYTIEDYGNKVYFQLTNKGIETYRMLDTSLNLLGFSKELDLYKD
jgi:hypothetical protein